MTEPNKTFQPGTPDHSPDQSHTLHTPQTETLLRNFQHTLENESKSPATIASYLSDVNDT